LASVCFAGTRSFGLVLNDFSLIYVGAGKRCGHMEELTRAQTAIVKEIENLIVELLGGTEEQIWKKTFDKILKLVDEFELGRHKRTMESIYDKFMKEGLYEYAGRFAAKYGL
jgi:hypothetical protein